MKQAKKEAKKIEERKNFSTYHVNLEKVENKSMQIKLKKIKKTCTVSNAA